MIVQLLFLTVFQNDEVESGVTFYDNRAVAYTALIKLVTDFFGQTGYPLEDESEDETKVQTKVTKAKKCTKDDGFIFSDDENYNNDESDEEESDESDEEESDNKLCTYDEGKELLNFIKEVKEFETSDYLNPSYCFFAAQCRFEAHILFLDEIDVVTESGKRKIST